MITIVDYGMGNLRSVQKALDKLGCETRVSARSEDVSSATHVIVPGVGAFGDCMKAFDAAGLRGPVADFARSGRPLLGICLGMQLFLEESEESPGVTGLGLFRGAVRRIPGMGLKVPHMGWNSVETVNSPALFEGLGPDPYMYFVHSYYVDPADDALAIGRTDYGIKFVAALAAGNVMGVQFHPEKSQALGLRMLENFARLGPVPALTRTPSTAVPA